MSPRQLESLYHQHAQAVFAFLMTLTRSEPDTRDLLQDVFLRAARRPAFTLRNPRAFLLRSAHNAWVDHVRRDARRHAVLEELDPPDPPAPPDHDESLAALADALAHLPPEQRAIIHLKIWENLTFARIARTLEIPANTAASRYRYGLERLRKILNTPHADEIH